MRPQLVAHRREVRRVVGHADVLGETDRADRVEVALGHVAVVHEAHLGQLTQALAVDRPLGPVSLLPRERHAERLDAVVLRGMADHATPAATDVEQPLPGLEVELAGDELVLVLLRLLEGGVRGRVDRARVGHRRPEDQLVEAVGHVVVVVDDLRVASAAVPQALDDPAPARQVLLRRGRRRVEVLPPEPAHELEGLRRAGDAPPVGAAHQVEQRVEVARVEAGAREVTGDPGPRHAEVSGRGEQVAQAALGPQLETDRRIGRPGGAAVVGRDAYRQVGGEDAGEGVGDLDRAHGVRTTLS